MHRIEVSDADTEAKWVFHVLRIAYELRFRKIAAWRRTSLDNRNVDGLCFVFNNGTSYTISCDLYPVRCMLRFGVLKERILELSLRQEMIVEMAFDRISAVYWVASQQFWKDLAEDLIPYLIAAYGGDDKTTTKRQSMNPT